MVEVEIMLADIKKQEKYREAVEEPPMGDDRED
jgi:hypothetical protein